MSTPPAAQLEGNTSAGRSSDTCVLGLLTDPGLPERLARWLVDAGSLAARLNQQGDGSTWEVEQITRYLVLEQDGYLPMLDLGREALADHGWDAVVLMTDLPRRSEAQAILADYSTTTGVGMVSVPALGALNLRRRVREVVCQLVVDHLAPATVRADEPGETKAASGVHGHTAAPHQVRGRRGGRWRRDRPVRRIASTHEGIDEHLALLGARGTMRLLAGMVRANRPWRLVPSLSPAMAGAMAGAAFGVFYSNIWTLADAFSTARLALVSALAIAAMIIWLIVDNSLWERFTEQRLREQAALANAATVITVSVAVIYMYVLLLALTLAATFAVIPGSFMQSTLGHPVGFGDYGGLAWLAASMGTIAGALGSGLAGEETVRQAAYSRRENQRRRRREETEASRTEG
ncbi:MAG: hypothetical protein M3165_06015 [Actinomycetota bacterium]|nr:hypothetical protein [Actinomycetota bacterium]